MTTFLSRAPDRCENLSWPFTNGVQLKNNFDFFAFYTLVSLVWVTCGWSVGSIRLVNVFLYSFQLITWDRIHFFCSQSFYKTQSPSPSNICQTLKLKLVRRCSENVSLRDQKKATDSLRRAGGFPLHAREPNFLCSVKGRSDAITVDSVFTSAEISWNRVDTVTTCWRRTDTQMSR